MRVSSTIPMPVAPPDPHRARRYSLDPLIALQIYLALLVLSPSMYIVEPLGAAGTPATIFGCLILVLWILGRASGRARIEMTPLHWIVGGFSVAMLLGFCAGMLRPITAEEVSSSLRTLIALSSGIGVMLFTADSIRTRQKLDAFLRFAVLVGTLLAVMGLVQFFFGTNFSALLHLPGLTQNSELAGLYERAGYPRVTGTAIHSIEFSAVIGTVLPVAAHLAINATRRRYLSWGQFAVMLVALPLAIARSGAVALIIGLVFALMVANRRQRISLLFVGAFAAVAFRAIVPGLLGTIRSLFTGASTDVSITGRVQDLDAVGMFFSQSPWIGRGVGTFIPSLYRTLDNQFLATAVEAGLVGVIALTVLFVGAGITSAIAGLNTEDRYLRTQAFAVATGLGTAMVLSFTFDSFGFPMAFGTMCVMLGASGAVWRVYRSESDTPPQEDRRSFLLPAARRLIVIAVIAGVFTAGGLAIQSARGDYEARTPVAVRVSKFATSNPYDSNVQLRGVSDVLLIIMKSDEVRDKLALSGTSEYSIAAGEGSLAPQSDVLGKGDLIWIATRADDEHAARVDADAVRSELELQLSDLQKGKAIPDGLKVITDTFAETQVFEVPVNRLGAAAGTLAVAGLSALVLTAGLRRRSEGRKRG